MGVNGRAKGSAFERTVASLIVDSFEEFGITKADCFRTPMSGGHLYAKKSDPGDLVLSPKLQKLFPFSVEAKAYRYVDMYVFMGMQREKSPQYLWWKQSVAASDRPTRVPLVVFKQNGSLPYAIVQVSDLIQLGLTGQTTPCLTFKWDGNAMLVLPFSILLYRCVRIARV